MSPLLTTLNRLSYSLIFSPPALKIKKLIKKSIIEHFITGEIRSKRFIASYSTIVAIISKFNRKYHESNDEEEN